MKMSELNPISIQMESIFFQIIKGETYMRTLRVEYAGHGQVRGALTLV